MIKIDRSADPPAILHNRGTNTVRRFCEQYDLAPADYTTGLKKFSFGSSIYGHRTVKTTLLRVQYDKCCFCEAKITHIDYGDVEHFRPKAGWRQQGSDHLAGPGYYWLAYEWSNPLVSCKLCNERFKGNLFPLKDPNARARCHRDDLGREEPLLINPAEVDPAEHIGFRHDVPYPLNDPLVDPRGQITIQALGLDRKELNERRQEWLNTLRVLYEIVLLAPERPSDLPFQSVALQAKARLERACERSAEYAAAVRAAIDSRFCWA